MKSNDNLVINKRLLARLSILWFYYVLTRSISSSFESKLLVRKIQSKPNNVANALDILKHADINENHGKYLASNIKNNDKDTQNVIVAALRVCGNANNHRLGLELYKKYKSEASRTMAISVLGKCNQTTKAVELLEDDFCPPSAASFNAAIAACGRAGNWQLALSIYQNKMQKTMINTLTTNALLTVLAKCRQGVHCLGILDQIVPTTNPKDGSESVTYSLVISALVRSNMLTEASEILQDLNNRPHYCSEKSIEAMNELVLSNYIQRSDWSGVDRIEQLMKLNQLTENNNRLDKMTNKTTSVQNDYRFHEWNGLEKLGKGKESYWVIGTCQNADKLNITVGCRPHRNPTRNGIQILFFENVFNKESNSWSQEKLGYLLMKNNRKEQTSSLLGMYLKSKQRGRGISKVCLSIWIWLSLKGSFTPITGIIRKPLLALILQHTFNYVDSMENNGVRAGNLVELSQDPNDPKSVVLYSLSGRSLEGALSFSDMKTQNLKITLQQPSTRGRVVRIGSSLHPPVDKKNLQIVCDEILFSRQWKCNFSCEEIQLIFFGRILEDKILSHKDKIQ